MSRPRRKFDREFRDGAVRIVEETGRPVAHVARELGVGWHSGDPYDEVADCWESHSPAHAHHDSPWPETHGCGSTRPARCRHMPKGLLTRV